jgi:hypothetical protein
MDLIELQAALISSDQVRALVDAIASGEAPPEQLPRSKEEIRRDQSGLLLRIAARDFGGRLPVVKLARHPLVLAAAISRTRTESLLAALAQEGVIARGWFRGGVYAIRWPRKRWESQFPDSAPVVRAQYTRDPRPVSDSVPEHTKAVPELSGTGSAAPGSAQVPADTALILQLAEAQRAQGEPVNHSAIARQLGKRRQTSLRLVKQVLQQDAPCNPS